MNTVRELLTKIQSSEDIDTVSYETKVGLLWFKGFMELRLPVIVLPVWVVITFFGGYWEDLFGKNQ